MSKKECTLSDEDLILKCEEWISKLCKSGGRAWCLRIPVDFNEDPDMIFSEIIKRFKNNNMRSLQQKVHLKECPANGYQPIKTDLEINLPPKKP